MNIRDVKIAILQELSQAAQPSYKYDLLWSNYPGKTGTIEHRLGVTFDIDQRNMAIQACEEMRNANLIRMAQTNSNPAPENWIEITEPGREALKNGLPNNEEKRGIFISHIVDESAVARKFQTHIRNALGEDTPIFVSSDYRSIPGGKEWFPEIVNAIRRAKVVVVLLSKESVDRRWINFEAGVGLGAMCRVIPIVIGNIQKSDVGPPLSQLQVRALNDVDDALGVFRDLAEAIGAEINSLDIASFVREVEGEVNRLPMKGVTLEPSIKREGNRFTLNFALKHTGNRDVRLIKLWAAVPRHLVAGAVHLGNCPPVLTVDEQAVINQEPYLVKEYHCTDAAIPPAYQQGYPRLPMVFQNSMSPYSLPRFSFPIKGDLDDANRSEFIQFQVFAEGLTTQLHRVQLKELLP